MRYLLAVLAIVLLPSVAVAQERITMADYVALCLALWDGAPDISARASELGLVDSTGGTSGASITIEKSTMRLFKSASGNVSSISTVMEEGKQSWCDINVPVALDRADLDVLAKALDLDGQVVTLGQSTIGSWRIRKRRPPVLVRTILGRANTIVVLVRFEPSGATAAAKPQKTSH
ncbi:hypothetical protein SSBR45G_03770 [Bradyrhizobium sp. SSBR45G]|uniref:hypothetical protein n=1 Tax=unclassified Bradyrhizobium TaxID=2631580 RepID=UPI002342923E|nr:MULTISPECIES: hypothetical protein [unclassified Bradyrhizobium]GLH75469.1 hypothetical protein SSBR45G_03770 [Bradyrhizobium sp. SSBR45G]GLH82744.1 hypothetical protein SSBR45R_02040 [Bradyrhizobium sp. SSBR45R]